MSYNSRLRNPRPNHSTHLANNIQRLNDNNNDPQLHHHEPHLTDPEPQSTDIGQQPQDLIARCPIIQSIVSDDDDNAHSQSQNEFASYYQCNTSKHFVWFERAFVGKDVVRTSWLHSVILCGWQVTHSFLFIKTHFALTHRITGYFAFTRTSCTWQVHFL